MRYKAAGGGSKTATWTPDITEAGYYYVYAWWSAYKTRASNAPYTINHADGSDTIRVNQQTNGGVWNLLETDTTDSFYFDVGTSGSVVLSDDADGVVVADAIRFDNVNAPKSSVRAPIVIGDNTTYGFYKTGHGRNAVVECLDCHDASKVHIDDDHRTYASSSDNYQDGYRLRSVNGGKPMILPRPTRAGVYASLGDFALCGDCHNLYEVLGQNLSDESHTNFRGDAAPVQNNHNYHIRLGSVHFDSDWNGIVDSTESCITCHNVHGPPNQAMIRHGELTGTSLTFCYLTSVAPQVCDPDATLQESEGSKFTWGGGSVSLNGMCDAGCHSGGKALARDPLLWPKVIDPKAEPDTVPEDEATDVLLTAFVLDHDDNVSSVTIDLTEIGGSASQAMYDDGTNGGDVTGGDGTYSYNPNVTLTVGSKTLPVTAADPAEDGYNEIVFQVASPGKITIDNPDAVFVDEVDWNTWNGAGETFYGADMRYKAAGGGSKTATWTPDITLNGYYKVYTWWSAYSARASNAPYTINHAGGSDTIRVSQKANGGVWNLLETDTTDSFYFNVGTSGSVVLSDDADGTVVADAVKFELQP
jgi:hypothetical protein